MIAALSLALCNIGFAEEKSANDRRVSAVETKKEKTVKDHVMMMDGKMMVVKDGKSMAMDKEMTMGNGCKVMTNGKVVMKDGKEMMMKEGEMMSMDGKMMKGERTVPANK